MLLTRLFAAVLALDVLGVTVSVLSNAEGLGDALLNGTPINAPVTFVAVQAVVVLAATRYRAGAAILAPLCALSVLSGLFDGAYATDLATGERAIQLGIVVSTVALGACALRLAVRPIPRTRAATVR